MSDLEILRTAAAGMRADADKLTVVADRLADAHDVEANAAAHAMRRMEQTLPEIADWLDVEALYACRRDPVRVEPLALAVARAYLEVES